MLTLQPWLKTLFLSCGTQSFVIVGSAVCCEQANIDKVACASSISRVYTSDVPAIAHQCLATLPELHGADLASPHHIHLHDMSYVCVYMHMISCRGMLYMQHENEWLCRDPQTGKPRTVRTLLRTTGGDCSQAVGKSMASLFAGAGSPSLFYWDQGMWQLSNKAAGAVLQTSDCFSYRLRGHSAATAAFVTACHVFDDSWSDLQLASGNDSHAALVSMREFRPHAAASAYMLTEQLQTRASLVCRLQLLRQSSVP